MDNAPIEAEALPALPSLPAQPAGTQPRDLGQILSEAFVLYRTHAAQLIATAAVPMVPLALLKDGILALAVGGQSVVGLLLWLLGAIASIPFVVLATYLAEAALTVLVSDRAGGGAMRWQDPWPVVLRRLGPLLLTSLLVSAGVAAGLLFCLLPGIAFGVLAAFAIPVVLLEGKSGLAAIARSIELVRTDWLRVVAVLLVFGVIGVLAKLVGESLFQGAPFLGAFVADLAAIAATPLPILGLVLLYQDLTRPDRPGLRRWRANAS